MTSIVIDVLAYQMDIPDALLFEGNRKHDFLYRRAR